MKPNAIEIKLILSAPGMGWEYVARKNGEVVAASDGDLCYPRLGAAFSACIAEIEASLTRKGGDDGR